MTIPNHFVELPTAGPGLTQQVDLSRLTLLCSDLFPMKNSTSRLLAQIVVLSSIGMNIGGFDHCIPFRGFAEYVVHKFRGTAL